MTREERVIMEVEANFEKEHKATLLSNCVTDQETRRLAHSFLADLAGSRKSLQRRSSKELIQSFMELVFNKMIELLEKNPFEKFYVVSVTSASDKELIDVENLYSLLTNADMRSIMNEINASCEDINVSVESIKPEKWGRDSFYIPVGIRFND